MAAKPYRKGYTKEQARAVDAERKRAQRVTETRGAKERRYAVDAETKRQRRIDELRDKEVIVWDGEGMKLSGDDKPQHYVLFGCSARPESPLVIDHPTGRLVFEEIADYCLDVVAEHPNAIHLGYYFKYDQNMIIWSLPWPAKHALYDKGSCVVKRGTSKYYIRLILGKSIRITRVSGLGRKSSILIEDFAPFFASSFVVAYERLFKVITDPERWAVVRQGKAERSAMLYQDMAKVRRYWTAEIVTLLELATEFRDVMFRADFMLTQWHGPGALANYIRRKNKLIPHEWGGKEENLTPALHEAIKCAYVGGHFEDYKIGRIEGPIHSYDINSAYPAAFCQIPSLAEGGWWEHIGPVSREQWERDALLRTSFSVFRVRWVGPSTSGVPLGNRRIQPLPHRDRHGAITYPMHTIGWYWAPEVCVAMQFGGRTADSVCEIIDGWRWHPLDPDLWPWETVLREMYQRRLVLKNNQNPMEMAFKLGPNSMYGKSAQRVGSDDKPPGSHTLCIAGYVTSTCRAEVMRLMYNCQPDTVIAVETDGVFTTTGPEQLLRPFPMSKELGEWSHKVYDEMIILQNGVYLLRKGDVWEPPKTRGFSVREFQDENGKTDPVPVLNHLRSCNIGEKWPSLQFSEGEAFIGLGTAIGRAGRTIVDGPRKGKRTIVPFRAAALHCTWVPDTRELDIEGRKGKRAHWSRDCRACQRGESPADTAHDTVINSITNIDPREIESAAYILPWEKEGNEERWRQDKRQAPEHEIPSG